MVRTETVWKMKTPTWDESFTLYVFNLRTHILITSDLDLPTDTLKLVIFEDKKKGVQRKVGEIKMLPAGQKQNELIDLVMPIEGEKGRTVGELKMSIRYKVCFP